MLLLGFSSVAKTADVNPLRPIDASSPRATLQGFVDIMDETYSGMADLLKSYAGSDRLYLSPDEQKRQMQISEALDFVVAFLGRPPARTGATAFAAVVGVLAEAVLLASEPLL
jgi:hypothetical protein